MKLRSDRPLRAGRPTGRLEGHLTWEDQELGPDLLVIEAGQDAAPIMSRGPEAMLVAAYSLALLRNERRVLVEGAVCPRLCDGLAAFGARLATWHPELEVPVVEASEGLSVIEPAPEASTGLFLSGGIDGFALLEMNLRLYPPGHPGRFGFAIHIFGLGSFDHEPGGQRGHPERMMAANEYADRLDGFCAKRGIRLIRVRSNTRALFPDFDSWALTGWALGLVAPGLSFDRAIDEVWIASDGAGLGSPPPWAQSLWTHLVSTSATHVVIGQPAMQRMEKVARIARWSDVHSLLRVCPQYHEVVSNGRLNCGRCEKCLRTMLGILACGARPAIPAFPKDDLEPSDLHGLAPGPAGAPFYRELIGRLEAVGRPELAGAVKGELARFEASAARAETERSFLHRLFRHR